MHFDKFYSVKLDNNIIIDDIIEDMKYIVQIVKRQNLSTHHLVIEEIENLLFQQYELKSMVSIVIININILVIVKQGK